MSEPSEDIRYFEYGPEAIEHLCSRDARLAEVIERVGPIRRRMDGGLFESVIHNIVGQQISGKALASIWSRMEEGLSAITPASISQASFDELRSFGLSQRKAEYAHDFAQSVQDGSFDLDAVSAMPDEEAINALTSVRGIGRWTAEMLLFLCLGRQDILAFDDLGIQRGLRMVYHHRRITKKLYEKYRRRYSPYGSVASLYLWAVSSGMLPDYRDYAPKRKTGKGRS